MTPSPNGGSPQAHALFAGVHTAEFLVVGSGVAGLSAALELARLEPRGRTLVLTRDRLGRHGASPLAQGGIAAALDPTDSPRLHARDTLEAAAGLAEPEVIRVLTEGGPERIRRLLEIGTRFDLEASGDLALGLEGAHSRRRIVHADGDRTGAEVTRALSHAAATCEGIEALEGMRAIDLLRDDGRVRGAIAVDGKGSLHMIRAGATLLATGGPGRVYLRTTAPPGLDGDGMVMAARARARLRDLEFVQFHPTALDVQADPLPLVTEALRGSGAVLVDGEGRRILGDDELDELASRDRVARAIWELSRQGQSVFLDARGALGERIRDRFPGVCRLCEAHGIDPVSEPIPVAPAAHYHMGGIAVDHQGRASVEGLWAVGEVAASGVHGANRLASNSLLEGLVFGPLAARSALEQVESVDSPDSRQLRLATEVAAVFGEASGADPLTPAARARIRELMWDRVGVVRDEEGLTLADRELEEIEAGLDAPARGTSNLLLTARMITRSALLRKESLGSHWRSDSVSRTGQSARHSSATLTRAGAEDQIEVVFEPESPAGPSARPSGAHEPRPAELDAVRVR